MGDYIWAFLIFILVLIILIFVFCGHLSNELSSVDGTDMKEWISPDGVHYWFSYRPFSRYGQAMAPRYDSSGNLIIDK